MSDQRIPFVAYNEKKEDSAVWRIACVTYNVNGKKSESDQMEQLLQFGNAETADIVVIGLQVTTNKCQFYQFFPVDCKSLCLIDGGFLESGSFLILLRVS